jgi:hypothetical protein
MKFKPDLNEGESAQDYVDFLNGEIPERKGTPVECVCSYCLLHVTTEELQEFGISRTEFNESPKEFQHCTKCTGAAQRNCCG